MDQSLVFEILSAIASIIAIGIFLKSIFSRLWKKFIHKLYNDLKNEYLNDD